MRRPATGSTGSPRMPGGATAQGSRPATTAGRVRRCRAVNRPVPAPRRRNGTCHCSTGTTIASSRRRRTRVTPATGSSPGVRMERPWHRWRSASVHRGTAPALRPVDQPQSRGRDLPRGGPLPANRGAVGPATPGRASRRPAVVAGRDGLGPGGGIEIGQEVTGQESGSTCARSPAASLSTGAMAAASSPGSAVTPAAGSLEVRGWCGPVGPHAGARRPRWSAWIPIVRWMVRSSWAAAECSHPRGRYRQSPGTRSRSR